MNHKTTSVVIGNYTDCTRSSISQVGGRTRPASNAFRPAIPVLLLLMIALLTGCFSSDSNEIANTDDQTDQHQTKSENGNDSVAEQKEQPSDDEPVQESKEDDDSVAVVENKSESADNTVKSEVDEPNNDTHQSKQKPAPEKELEPLDNSIQFADPFEIPTIQNWLNGNKEPVLLAKWDSSKCKIESLHLTGLNLLADPYVSCKWSEDFDPQQKTLDLFFRAPGNPPVCFASFGATKGRLLFAWKNVEALTNDAQLIKSITNGDLAATANSLRWNALNLSFCAAAENDERNLSIIKLLSRRPARFVDSELHLNLWRGNQFLNNHVRLIDAKSHSAAPGKAQAVFQLTQGEKASSRLSELHAYNESNVVWFLTGKASENGYVVSVSTAYIPHIPDAVANKILLEKGRNTNRIGDRKEGGQQKAGNNDQPPPQRKREFVNVACITYHCDPDGKFILAKELELLIPDANGTTESAVETTKLTLENGRLVDDVTREANLAVKKQLRLWERKNKSNQNDAQTGVITTIDYDFPQKIEKCLAFLQWYPNRTTEVEFQLQYDSTPDFVGKDQTYKQPIVVIKN